MMMYGSLTKYYYNSYRFLFYDWFLNYFSKVVTPITKKEQGYILTMLYKKWVCPCI